MEELGTSKRFWGISNFFYLAIRDAKWFGQSPNHFGPARRTKVLWQASQYIPYLKSVWRPKPLQCRYNWTYSFLVRQLIPYQVARARCLNQSDSCGTVSLIKIRRDSHLFFQKIGRGLKLRCDEHPGGAGFALLG